MKYACMIAIFVSALFVLCSPVGGMVYYNDSTDNTSAPTGDYTDSGWNYVGAWSSGAGTVISSKHFITAKHFSIPGSGEFILGGTTYNYSSHDDDSASDLRIVEIQESFSSWADLYENSDESGKEAVLFGRGYTRGDAVVVSSTTKGWKWSSSGQGTKRWGTNYVSAAGSGYLQFEFNSGGGTNEAALAMWDSGGSMFIKDGATWKIAGVNYGVTGPYDDDSDHSSYFDASIFDKGGLYEKIGPNWTYHNDTGTDKPGVSYGTRISDRADWINGIIPEPGTFALFALGGAGLLLRRRRRRC